MKKPLLLICLCLPTLVTADVVVLRNGNEIQGEIIKEAKDHVVLRFPGGQLVLKRRDIRKVERQSRFTYLVEEGEKSLARKSYRQALKSFQEALEEEAGSDRALRGLRRTQRAYAAHLATLNRHEEALAAYEIALSSSTGDEELLEEMRRIERVQGEVRAAELDAEKKIARGNIDEGIRVLQHVHERYPDRQEAVAPSLASALVTKADSLFGAGKMTEAGALYHRAVAIDPTQVEKVRGKYAQTKVSQVWPLIKQNKFGEVKTLAEEGLELAPENKSLRFFRGLALEAEGNAEEARRVYTAITEERRAKSGVPITQLRGRAEAVIRKAGSFPVLASPAASEVLPGDFRTRHTRHFTVHHRNNALGQEVGYLAEKSYHEIFRYLGCKTHWRSPCEIFIYPSRKEYLEAAGTGSWSGAAHQLRVRRGVLSEHHIYSYQGQPRLADGILKHEIAHALLMHRLNYPQSIPLWANEGFAVTVEPKYLHDYYERVVKTANTGEAIIPLKDLVARDSYPPERLVSLFYAQSFLLVRHLLRYGGTPRFVKFLRDITHGDVSAKEALKTHYRVPSLLALQNAMLADL